MGTLKTTRAVSKGKRIPEPRRRTDRDSDCFGREKRSLAMTNRGLNYQLRARKSLLPPPRNKAISGQHSLSLPNPSI
jgi:hypothetical protein